MLAAYGQLKSYDNFKKVFTELLWDGIRWSEMGCRVYEDRYTYRSGEVSLNIALDTPTWPVCFRFNC